MNSFSKIAVMIPLASILISAQSPNGVPIQMVLTAESGRTSNPQPLKREDVKAFQGRRNLPVTELVPLQGQAAAMELYFLIDDKIDPSADSRFDEIRRFIRNQPPTTAVGIAYMDNGEAHIVCKPAADHARAAEAVRLPSGAMGFMANPYYSLSSLISHWPAGPSRREVIMVTDGVDRFGDVGGASMYLDVAIEDAQRSGVEVFSIYAPGVGHASHSHALIRGGADFLAQLAEQTGGEAYFNAAEPLHSFSPFLADISQHLAHQYRVTFLAAPVPKPQVGLEPMPKGFQLVVFATQAPNVELIGAHGFYLDPEGH